MNSLVSILTASKSEIKKSEIALAIKKGRFAFDKKIAELKNQISAKELELIELDGKADSIVAQASYTPDMDIQMVKAVSTIKSEIESLEAEVKLYEETKSQRFPEDEEISVSED